MPLVSKTFSEIITFERATNASYFNSAGVLTNAAANAPRFDYNPSTLAAQGLLIEESRANQIRNNTMVGAVAGTPGTAPTNWDVTPTGAATVSVIGTGTENGITYIDVRLQAAVGETLQIRFDGTTQIVAADTQTWTSSFYTKIASGSAANCTLANRMVYRTAVGAAVTVTDTAFVPTTASLVSQRVAVPVLAVGATIARVTNQILFTAATGAVDITLRIGLPQLELGAFATSVIPTTTTALTRAADVASVNTLSPWYNATEGTLYAEAQWIAPSVAVPQFAAQLASGSTDYYAIFKDTTTANMTGRVRSGGADQAYMYTTGVISANTTYKTALAYAVNNFAACTNAGTVQTDTAGVLPTSITTLGLGAATYTTAVQLNGYLRRVTYYPRRLSNAELQTLTT